MEAVKDASGLYEVERRAYHAERPGFRIAELQIGPKQKVPWHTHTNVQDTFYVLAGKIRIFLQEPKDDVQLAPGETYTVRAKAAAPRHQCGREFRDLPRAAGRRRIRFRAADVSRTAARLPAASGARGCRPASGVDRSGRSPYIRRESGRAGQVGPGPSRCHEDSDSSAGLPP